MDWGVYLFSVFFSCILFACYKLKKLFAYFEERNIPYVKTKYFIGSDPKGVLLKRQQGESFDLIYKELEGEQVGGFFQAVHPMLMIRDPNLVNEILTTAFDSFIDRHFLPNEKKNPLDANLFFLKGNRWKYLRNKLSPIFSSSKLKWMHEGMNSCGDMLMGCVEEVADGRDIDMLDLFSRYTIDVVGSCMFGLEPEVLKNPDSELRKMPREILNPSGTFAFLFLLQFSAPRLLHLLNIKAPPAPVEQFFFSMTNQVLSHRRKTGDQRKDLIQLLLQLQDKEVADLGETRGASHSDKIEFTDKLLAAQLFIFLVGGFETSSRSLHYMVYFLAKNQAVQDKVRAEILQVKAKYGKFSYDALQEMTYLDKCISETLRLYPVAPSLTRQCTKDYTLSNGTRVEQGLTVVIPLYSLQRDPKYFPDPLKFNPDRWDEPQVKGTYAPFGDGPRMCIGKKFAQIEMIILLSRLLEQYRFDHSTLNKEDIELEPRVNMIGPTHPLYVKITKLT